MVVILIVITTSASSQESSQNNDPWHSLFDGKSLEGWEVKCIEKDRDKTFWTVEGGTILCNSMGSADHNYIWLLSEKEYGDFELRLKYQVSRKQTGNSGVQVRSRYYDHDEVEEGAVGWLDGPQVDIEPHIPWRTGLIYDETRETKRWINPSLKNWEISEGDIELHQVVHYFEDEEPGWNEMTIICTGMKIKTIVNSIVVSDYDGSGVLDDRIHTKQKVGTNGHIALQLHKNSQNLMRFKEIEIRPL